MNKVALRRFNRILNALQLSISVDDDGLIYYPGRIKVEFDLDKLLKNSDLYNISIIKSVCHEIGHWLIVSPQRRNRKDFGIPSNTWEESAKLRYKYDVEEIKAQLIENSLCKFLFNSRFDTPKKDIKRWSTEFPHAIKWWNERGKIMVETLCNIVS